MIFGGKGVPKGYVQFNQTQIYEYFFNNCFTDVLVGNTLPASAEITTVSNKQNSPTNEDSVSSWQYENGAFDISDDAVLPTFPSSKEGYTPLSQGSDFWGNPYNFRGTLRLFQDSGWTQLDQFPNTMNGCSNGLFMIRWRSLNPDVLVETATGYFGEVQVVDRVASPAIKGIMQDHNCSEPLFKFSKVVGENPSTLVDIVYEIQFWTASP